jgi:CRISPR-associated protein Csh1
MFDEAIKVFEAGLEQQPEQWLYDNYVPAPGTYILLNLEDDFSVRNIFDVGKPDKKTGEIPGENTSDYKFISFLDKNSRLISMNKAVDSGKIIHSNNYYSFFIKKESIKAGKLQDKNIETYYGVLSDPYVKYGKGQAKQIYEETEKILGPVNTEIIGRIRTWVKQNLNTFLQQQDISLEAKDYLKIFFVYAEDERTREEIKKEGQRYIRPNIFNNNKYNQLANNTIFGLHSNNMGLNEKKPFLENKSRKISIPCAVTMERAIIQNQFMEYLSSEAAKGKNNVYIDLDKKTIKCVKKGEENSDADIESGLYFRVRQGKTELEIHSFERITGYNSELKQPFRLRMIFSFREKAEEAYSGSYGMKDKLYQIESLVNEVLFGKYLINNYKTAAGDLPNIDHRIKEELLLCREQLWNWFYNNNSRNVKPLLDKACKRLIKDTIENDYLEKAKHQFNLWFSLTDYLNENRRNEVPMSDVMSEVRRQLMEHVMKSREEWMFENDDEYYYAVGQISRYILELSRAAKKSLDMVKPILTVRDDKMLKKRVALLAKKYDYAIEMKYARAMELLGKVLTYMPDETANEVMIMAGYVDKNILYMSKKKYDEEEMKNNNAGL